MRNSFQNIAALLSLIAGIVLCYIAYIIELYINDSVLWFFAQCIMYSASIFGVTIITNKIKKNEDNK